MTQELGIGILGCGNTSQAYFELIPKFRGLELRSCADWNWEVAQVRAAAYAVQPMTVRDLLLSEDISLIVNLTAPDAHWMIIREILTHGKHVYSEKPLVANLSEGLALKELAEEKKLQVGCAPDTFLGGAAQTARKAIDEGLIGRITGGTCHAMNFGMEAWHPNPGIFYKRGGGPVMDFGPYYLGALTNLIGPVKSVTALSAKPQKTRKVVSGPNAGEVIDVAALTTTHAVLDFGDGRIVSLSASWDVQAHGHRPIEIYGTEGSLFLPDPVFFGGNVVFVSKTGDRRVLDHSDHPFGRPNLKSGGQERANYRSAGLADMVRAMRDGGDFRCSLDRALHTVATIAAIQEAAGSGQVTPVGHMASRPPPLSSAAARQLLRPPVPS